MSAEVEANLDGPDNPELDAELAAAPKPAAPQKRPLVYLVSHLVGGNMASMALRMAAGVLQGRLVAPAKCGAFLGDEAGATAPVPSPRNAPWSWGRGGGVVLAAVGATASGWCPAR